MRDTVTDDGGIELSLQGGGGVLVAENDLAWIELLEPSDGFTIRNNVVHATGFVQAGITLGTGEASVEGNAISDVPTGIVVPDGATPTISGNQLEGPRVGIRVLGTETAPVIEGNRFCGNEQDLAVPDDSSLTLDPSNEVCDDAVTE